MLKKIILTSVLLLLTSGLVFSYIYFVGREVEKASQGRVCRKISVRIADSRVNKLISTEEVLSTIGSGDIFGKRMDSIDLHNIEEKLSGRGEVLSCEAYLPEKDSMLVVTVTQRRAAIRLITNEGESYYCDRDGFIFPVLNHMDVPVITGEIPVALENGRKGFACEDEKKWLDEVLGVTSWIDSHRQWRDMFSQIDVEPNGDLDLYPSQGNVRFVIGNSADMDTKFRKISQYYRGIEPAVKKGKYSCVNVKYKNQIICKQ